MWKKFPFKWKFLSQANFLSFIPGILSFEKRIKRWLYSTFLKYHYVIICCYYVMLLKFGVIHFYFGKKKDLGNLYHLNSKRVIWGHLRSLSKMIFIIWLQQTLSARIRLRMAINLASSSTNRSNFYLTANKLIITWKTLILLHAWVTEVIVTVVISEIGIGHIIGTRVTNW